MATTSPDNLRTPDPGDPYNLVPDLATLANDVQTALNARDQNVLKGTGAQRAVAESTATPGMLWVDTDGIRMIWRRGVTTWEPAVWQWSGTASQMNAFTQAPNGFVWFNTTTGTQFFRTGGVWQGAVADDTGWIAVTSFINGWSAVSGYPVAYRRMNGVVYLRGQITGGSSATAFTLPSGFRIGSTAFHAVLSGLNATVAMARVGVSDTGTVAGVSGQQPNLSGVPPFPADG